MMLRQPPHYLSVMWRPESSVLRLYPMDERRKAQERDASRRKDATRSAATVGKGLQERMDCVLPEELPEHIARLLAKLRETGR
jgi:hypothetical protein